ncbi:MAG: DUF4332 domain-containing protein [Planctomycetes bacterium]|nr:DUF4332 domain-containing protein [Planctomycetota bacterium]
MRISQLSLEGRGAWPDLHLDTLSPQLNVLFADPRGGKSTVARLLGHLLYGKTDSPWRLQFGQSVPRAEGTISVDAKEGQFVLRRHCDVDRSDVDLKGRLTVTSADGGSVDSQTVRNLLSDLDPALASQLFAVDFSESPNLDNLLSETFSRQFMATGFMAAGQQASPDFTTQRLCCNASRTSTEVERIDRRRVDELVRQRDAIAQEIEQQISVRRRESGVLEQELHRLDTELTEKRQQSKVLRSQLRGVESQLAELEAQLRYFSLETTIQRDADDRETPQTRQQLEELDAEIARCRQALGDLQTREAVVRIELAQLSPDGTADAVTCLADGRTTLSVIEHLLDDLDAEISQLARAHEPGRCYGTDAHAKLSPVAEILRQQVYTLCGQLTEQERIARRQEVVTESRQLIRSQTDLSERLELLLSRRESLIQQSRQIGQHVALSPLPPVVDHCRCDHHGHFLADSNSYRLGNASRPRMENENRERREQLERERDQLVETLTHAQRDLERLENHWKNLQSQRSGLLGKATIEQQQAELKRLETLINRSLESTTEPLENTHSSVWRASDVLAQLTDGQLVQIHLERHGRRATVVDRAGQNLEIESLSLAQHDAIYLALTLALVGSYARRGIRLPLILDEPFLRQDPASAAAMAGVLEEFARAGHQLLVFTEDRDAQRRFRLLGTQVFELESLRRKSVAPTTTLPQSITKTQPTTETRPSTETKTSTRVVRRTADDRHAPAIRLASSAGENDRGDVFYLTESSPMGEFPVLGNETGALFQQIDIRTVEDLLSADAHDVASKLGRREIRPETVILWQTHMGLMCFVPELTLADAQLLEACEIDSPDDLFDLDAKVLLRRIEAFLDSDRGRRFDSSRSRISSSRMSGWIRGSQRNRDRWNRSRSRYTWHGSQWSSRRNGSSRRSSDTLRPSTRRTSRSSSSRTGSSKESKQASQYAIQSGERRFYLQRTDPVEDGPSIGPKTADRLAKVGIRTVADLLAADPETTTEELGVRHITAELFAAWQQQSRLVCRIPQLRGFGAQLLVACGFTEPEQISDADAESVATKILEFSETKKGQRILRNGEAPSREIIDEWIESAGHTRPLEAA